MHLLKRFEKTLGRGPLVTSKGDEVELTSIGSEHLAAAEALASAFEGFDHPHEELRVSGYPIHAVILVPLVAAYKELHDSVGVVFYRISDASRGDRGAEIIHRLIQGELDLVVAPSGRKDTMLRERQLYRWNLRVALQGLDPNRSKSRLSIRDLKDYRFLVAPAGHRSREIFDDLATQSNMRPTIFMESSDQNVLRQVASHETMYAAIIPDDSFGLPDPKIGPLLTEAVKPNALQSYSLYYRKEVPGDARPVRQRKRLIGSLAAWIIQELNKTE
jgi:hypothetical protein